MLAKHSLSLLLVMSKRDNASGSQGPPPKRPHHPAPPQDAPPQQLPPGGYRQKVAWAQKAGEHGPSALAELLIHKWSWGEMSAPLLQQISAAAMQDGLPHLELQKLASLGSNGKFPNNMHHELTLKLQASPVAEAMSTMSVHFKKDGEGSVESKISLLLPHELFAMMHQKHPQQFIQKFCGGGYDQINKFWDDMVAHPSYAAHPLAMRTDHKQKCIPLALHGDGVPIAGVGKSWSKSVDAYSFCSLLSRGTTLSCNFLICLVYWKLLLEDASKNAYTQMSKKLAWSFYWLFVGKWPTRDEDNNVLDKATPAGRLGGTSLAGGFYGVLWIIKGDLKHVAKAYGFPYPTASSPCACCQANSSDKTWTDGRLASAEWVKTTWTNASGHWPTQSHIPYSRCCQVWGLRILCLTSCTHSTLAAINICSAVY